LREQFFALPESLERTQLDPFLPFVWHVFEHHAVRNNQRLREAYCAVSALSIKVNCATLQPKSASEHLPRVVSRFVAALAAPASVAAYNFPMFASSPSGSKMK